MWKYVSPKRRRIGLFVLALLLTFLYAGWYFTNDAFIRQAAKSALEGLTSGDVEIHKAEFSLFEGIRLEGVEVRLRDDKSPQPFFYASKVVLKHNPIALFLRRRLEVTEIKCIRPEVNIEYDKKAGMSNAERLFRQASQGKGSGEGEPFPLPSIYIVDGKLRPILKEGSRYEILDKEVDSWEWKCSLVPISATVYQVTLERKRDEAHGGIQATQSDESLWARLELDTATGNINRLQGAATDQLFNLLPPKYQEWINRYKPRGEFEAVAGENTKPDEGLYEIKLQGFSLELPEAEGGLTLADVQGFLLFTREGVRMKDVSGKVLQAGQAAFVLNGTYEGYDKTSPFQLDVEIKKLRLPEKATGSLEGIVLSLQQKFKPEGTADVSLHYQRDKLGRHSGDGVVKLNDIAVEPEFFPLPISKISGNIFFTAEGLKSVALKAWRDSSATKNRGTFLVNGTFAKLDGYQTYDITVDGTDVELDSEFRDALKGEYQKVWMMLKPAGRTDGRYRVIDPGEKAKNIYELDLNAHGQASARCDWFPYPLRNIDGEISLRKNIVTIKRFQSLSDDAICDISGRVENVNEKNPGIFLSVNARRVPIDKTLRDSFKGKARELIESLAVTGQASRVEAVINRPFGEEKINFDINALVKNVAYKYEKFPYAVTNAEGSLRVTSDEVEIRNLTGLHGDAEVIVNGKVFLAGDQPRLDLSCKGKNVTLNDEFAKALPEKTRDIWESLTPSGLADMNIHLKTEGEEPHAELTYHFTLDAKDMTIRYREFPYTFHGVTGTAEVWPGRVKLTNMQASHGKMQASISGEIFSGDKGDDATIQISAEDLPFDKEFLAAIPAEIVPLSNRFQPGGNCNAEITRLTFHRDPPPTTQPADKDKTQPRKVTWSVEGKLGFDDVSLDIGFGPRKLTGALEGKAAQADEGLSVLADGELKSLELHKHIITDIKGKLTKADKSNLLRLDKIVARAYEGRLAGEATIILTEPMSYRMSVSVENINVSELFNAGLPLQERQTQVNGRLTGQILLEAKAGKKPTRQAVGELEISRANMYKMPVILGLLNVIYLTAPGESAFNSGFIRYHLKNDVLLLQEIYLTGEPEQGVSRGISVLGSGTLNMKTDEMNVTFLTGPPGKLPRLDNIVLELLQALSKEIVEIRVTGTLKKPKMTTHSLRSLETIINRILAPSKVE